MERREFLSTITATSACAMAAFPIAGAQVSVKVTAQTQKKYGVKISVLRRGYEKEEL